MKLLKLTAAAAVSAGAILGVGVMSAAPPAHADHGCAIPPFPAIPHPDWLPCPLGAVDTGPWGGPAPAQPEDRNIVFEHDARPDRPIDVTGLGVQADAPDSGTPGWMKECPEGEMVSVGADCPEPQSHQIPGGLDLGIGPATWCEEYRAKKDILFDFEKAALHPECYPAGPDANATPGPAEAHPSLF